MDDVTHTSLPFDAEFDIEPKEVVRAVFFGLGADGTVGANKNSIKIIGEETDLHAQGYFVYDSKKSGAVTISHLRFGPNPIHSPLPAQAGGLCRLPSMAVFGALQRAGLRRARARRSCSTRRSDRTMSGIIFPLKPSGEIIAKKLKCYVIDAYPVAKATGMGGRINTIMQTCFFAISNVLPREEAIAQIKKAIRKTYARKGPGGRGPKFRRGGPNPGRLARSQNSRSRYRRTVTRRRSFRRTRPILCSASPR